MLLSIGVAQFLKSHSPSGAGERPITYENGRQKATKKRYANAPAMGPGCSDAEDAHRRRGTRPLCRTFGPQSFAAPDHALASVAMDGRRFAP